MEDGQGGGRRQQGRGGVRLWVYCGEGEAVIVLTDNAAAALAEVMVSCCIYATSDYRPLTSYPLIHLHVPPMRRVIQETYFWRYKAGVAYGP